MKEGSLVQIKNVSLLARVRGDDPDDKRKVVVESLLDKKRFSCVRDQLIELE